MKNWGEVVNNMTGIVGYGVYVPHYRLKLTDIAQMWEKDAAEITNGLRVSEKAVPGFDEDSATMAIGRFPLRSRRLTASSVRDGDELRNLPPCWYTSHEHYGGKETCQRQGRQLIRCCDNAKPKSEVVTVPWTLTGDIG